MIHVVIPDLRHSKKYEIYQVDPVTFMVLPMRRKEHLEFRKLISEENPRALMLTGLQEILQDTFHM